MKAYLKKGGTAVLDQVLFSGSNFLLNLFLVKLLTPADYGLFGSLYSLYLLTVIVFGAMLLEPYNYYKNRPGDTRQYTTLNAGFANALLLLSLSLTVVGWLAHAYLFVYASYTLTTCVIYFYKRHFLSILSVGRSLYISVLYFILVSAGLLLLNYVIPQSLFNAFLVLNGATILSVLPVVLSNEQFRTVLYRPLVWLQFRDMVIRQKKYAFHCVSSGILAWVPGNIYFILLPLFYSSELNAYFKALQNIGLPITHLNIAIVSLLVPFFIRSANPNKLIQQVSGLFVLIPVLYLLVILGLSGSIEHYIYNDKYDLKPLWLCALLLGIIPEIIANVFKAFFRSIDRPELVTRINLGNAFMALLCSYFVYRFGLPGVLGSYVVVNVFNLFSSVRSYRLETRHRQKTSLELV